MPRFSVETGAVKRNTAKIRGLDPSANPQAVGAALRESMASVLEEARTSELSGPRPRELDQVTGELFRSLSMDESGLPTGIVGGTPLVFGPVHEFGRQGRLSFLQPALDRKVGAFPEIMERHLLAALDRA